MMRRTRLRRSATAAGVLGALMVTACVPPGPAAPGAPTGSPGGATSCPMLPADNIWNTRVDTAPLDPSSAAYVATIGPSATMHADFGSGLWNGGPIGIPYVVVNAGQPGVGVSFSQPRESDPGPY